MTKAELDAAVAKLEGMNRAYQSRASAEVRKVYRAALQDMLRTGRFDEEAVNGKITEIYQGTVYKAADKIEALQYKYHSDALIRGKYTQDANLPHRFYKLETDGTKKTVNLDTLILPVQHRYKLSGRIWGTDEAKARGLATIDYCRTQGMGLKDTAKMLGTLCEPHGGKKVAMKVNRLFSVKDESGSVLEKRWQEGWMRDFADSRGLQFDKKPGSPFMQAFKDDGGQAWVAAHSVGTTGRRLLPQAHKDFVKALGGTSIDWRSARLIRTEAQSSFNAHMQDWGKENGGTGKYVVILASHRDAYSCRCQEWAAWSKQGGGKTLEEIKEHCGDIPPFHPNCECWLKPVFPTQEELLAEMEKMAGGNAGGGGTDDAAVEASKGVFPEPQETPKFVPEAKTVKEANAYAHDVLGIPRVDYAGCDAETANEWNKSISRTIDDFPEVKKNLNFVGSMQERNKQMEQFLTDYYEKDIKASEPWRSESEVKSEAKSKVAEDMKKYKIEDGIYAQHFRDNGILKPFSGITQNAIQGGNAKQYVGKLQQDVRDKFHPVGCNTIKSITDHEFGHLLDDLLKISDNPDIIKLFKGKTLDELTNGLSEYSWNNPNPKRIREFVSEAWAEYRNNPKPRPIAKQIGETIEKEYAKWKRKNLQKKPGP